MNNTYTQYEVPEASQRINLGVGQPSPKLLRWEQFTDSMKSIDEKNNKIMQYGYIPGFQEYREKICKMLSEHTGDTECKPEDMFMTNGISHAIFMIASLLRKNYSKVYVQDPTYFIILNMFKDLEYDFETFSLDNLDELEEDLYDDGDDNVKSLIYLVPFNQNPTGENIDEVQFSKLMSILEKFSNQTILLSDETYQMLYFNQHFNQMSLVSSSAHDYIKNIISLGTFSKLIAPALRLGWIYTKNKAIHKMLNTCGYMDSGGAVNQMMGKLLCNYLDKYSLNDILAETTTFLENNCNKICNILDKYPDYFEYKKPTGGYFVWVQCKQFEGKKFQDICSKNNLGFHLGDKFSPFNNFADYFRLSFSYYSSDDYKYLDERLQKSINDYNNIYNKITINILGGNGRLGTLICNEAMKENQLFNINKLERDLSNIIVTDKSIIVDVSSVDGTENLINHLIRGNYNIPIIIGTTGNIPINLIQKYAQIAGKEKVFVCSNFSIGVSSINTYLKEMMPNYWCINIEDQHHIFKKDAPSGTAKRFQNLVKDKVVNPDFEVECKREGEIIGYHKIHIFNDYEEIIIIHNAKDRALFAKGCLEYVKKMIT
jgi:2-aminoadipate transaminase